MKAVQIVKSGEPQTLRLVDIPIPIPKDDEVLVKVYAAGINFADVLARQGLYPDAPERPFVPGYEVAGTVEQIGSSVQDIHGGQRVLGLTQFGGYAEYAVCRSEFTQPLDESLSFAEGVTIPVNWVTAYHCLYFTGPFEKGYRVLVHTAAGGVGTAAVQLLKHAGGIVIGTAGSDKKISFLKKMGVDLPINYHTEDFSERIIREFGGRSVDIILDPVGGKTFKKEWKLLRANGRLISFGASSLAGKNKLVIWLKVLREFKISIFHLIGNSHGVYGVSMSRIVVERPEQVRYSFAESMKGFRSGIFKPVIDSKYPLDKAHEAHARLESKNSIGKIVLTNEHE